MFVVLFVWFYPPIKQGIAVHQLTMRIGSQMYVNGHEAYRNGRVQDAIQWYDAAADGGAHAGAAFMLARKLMTIIFSCVLSYNIG